MGKNARKRIDSMESGWYNEGSHQPVSYTHLDVYKRQVHGLGLLQQGARLVQGLLHVLHVLLVVAVAHGLVLRVAQVVDCLLYTSRCV